MVVRCSKILTQFLRSARTCLIQVYSFSELYKTDPYILGLSYNKVITVNILYTVICMLLLCIYGEEGTICYGERHPNDSITFYINKNEIVYQESQTYSWKVNVSIYFHCICFLLQFVSLYVSVCIMFVFNKWVSPRKG